MKSSLGAVDLVGCLKLSRFRPLYLQKKNVLSLVYTYRQRACFCTILQWVQFNAMVCLHIRPKRSTVMITKTMTLTIRVNSNYYFFAATKPFDVNIAISDNFVVNAKNSNVKLRNVNHSNVTIYREIGDFSWLKILSTNAWIQCLVLSGTCTFPRYFTRLLPGREFTSRGCCSLI